MSFENALVNERTTQLRVMWQGECWKNKDKFVNKDKGKEVMQRQFNWVKEKLELLVDSGSFVSLDFPLAVMEADDLEECMSVLENTVIVSPEIKSYEHLTYPVYAKDHSFSVNFVCSWAVIRFAEARGVMEGFLEFLKRGQFHITDNDFCLEPYEYPPEPFDETLAVSLSGYFKDFLEEEGVEGYTEAQKKFIEYVEESVALNQMFMHVSVFKDYLEEVKTEVNKEEK